MNLVANDLGRKVKHIIIKDTRLHQHHLSNYQSLTSSKTAINQMKGDLAGSLHTVYVMKGVNKMYLTILTKPKYKQITLEDLLNNPFISMDDIPEKKITVEISEEYGRELYNKRYRGLNLPDMSWTDDLVTEEHYRHFKIPKKNGKGFRPIDAPSETLKVAQQVYKTFIETNLKVLNHKAAHAYTSKRSIATNAETHLKNNSKWFLKIDLSNFFNSINGEWLKKMLLEVYPFKFIPEKELNRIVHLALLNGVLPQGSVLSPTLTNIVMVPIDHEITEKLHNYNKHHYVYTRYADDISISCKYKFNPKEILSVIEEVFNKWNVPFEINKDKTRFTSSNGANYHCGININYNKGKDETKLSLGHEKNNKFRAKINSFCLSGEEWDKNDIQKMLGLISYFKTVEKPFVEKVLAKYNAKYNTNILERAKHLISIK